MWKFFLNTNNRADQNKTVQGGFFLKINKRAGQIPIQMQENKRAGGFFFLKNNKRADQNKTVQGGIFSQN